MVRDVIGGCGIGLVELRYWYWWWCPKSGVVDCASEAVRAGYRKERLRQAKNAVRRKAHQAHHTQLCNHLYNLANTACVTLLTPYRPQLQAQLQGSIRPAASIMRLIRRVTSH